MGDAVTDAPEGSLGDRASSVLNGAGAIPPVVKKEKKIRLKINRLTTTTHNAVTNSKSSKAVENG